MRPDPEDDSIVWMHTGDEGIIDEEGYLRSTSIAQMQMGDADPSLLQLLVESRSVPDVFAVHIERGYTRISSFVVER